MTTKEEARMATVRPRFDILGALQMLSNWEGQKNNEYLRRHFEVFAAFDQAFLIEKTSELPDVGEYTGKSFPSIVNKEASALRRDGLEWAKEAHDIALRVSTGEKVSSEERESIGDFLGVVLQSLRKYAQT